MSLIFSLGHYNRMIVVTVYYMLCCFYPIIALAGPASTDSVFSLETLSKLENSHTGNVQKRFHAVRSLIKNYKNQSILNQLNAINQFYNHFTYTSEKKDKHVEDYWKSPNEFIIDGEGDCEEFAISKYFTAILMGISMDKLRITYVTSTKYNRAHMVLAYYAQKDSDPLILDNLTNEILPASKRPDLIPVYSFNGDRLWLAKKQHQEEDLGKSSDFSLWRKLIDRMQKGG